MIFNLRTTTTLTNVLNVSQELRAPHCGARKRDDSLYVARKWMMSRSVNAGALFSMRNINVHYGGVVRPYAHKTIF